ncbi:Uncharacterised protein [Mycobacterium xenopi]|nr:Uncharacterised protein [Mycobacterium xenopi]
MLGVVGAQLNVPAGSGRPLLPILANVGQHGLPSGGEELDDVGGGEGVDDALPQARWHPRADEQPHRVVAVQGKCPSSSTTSRNIAQV